MIASLFLISLSCLIPPPPACHPPYYLHITLRLVSIIYIYFSVFFSTFAFSYVFTYNLLLFRLWLVLEMWHFGLSFMTDFIFHSEIQWNVQWNIQSASTYTQPSEWDNFLKSTGVSFNITLFQRVLHFHGQELAEAGKGDF